MRGVRASILMGGVLVAVLVAMRLVRTDDSLQPEALTNGMTEDKASVPPISRSAPAQGPPRSGIRASDHGTAGGQTSTDTQLAGSDVISGEYVLHFYDEQDRQAFEAVARRLGVRIIDTLTFSHAIRIRVRSSDQLRELLDKGPTPTDWMPNRYVRSPEPEDGNTPLPPEAGYQAFGNQTLAWLGIGENATWGSGITVGILDTGVARSLRNGIARLDLVGESSTVATHGTAVASLIVGDDASLQGIAPDADLLSIKVLSDEGIGDAFTLAKGIIEAVDRGARVLTCSLGSRGDSSILSEAVRYAMARDVVLVAAAGNGAVSGVLYPARYEGVIAVAAVDAAGRHLYFSNRGTEVSLAAPGAGVMAAHPEGFPISFTGTSAAVPLVAGTVAALLSQNATLTPDDVRSLLTRYSNDAGAPGRDEAYGAGVLDVGRLMQRDTPGLYDMVAMIPHVNDNTADRTLYMDVSAQNRGTEPLQEVALVVDSGGRTQTFTFFNVGVGDTVTQPFSFSYDALSGAGIEFHFSVAPVGVEDATPGNNALGSTIAAE